MNGPKTAIIYLCWADEPKKYLSRALQAVGRQTYGREDLLLVIVYNGPRENEESQIQYIRHEIESNKVSLPQTELLEPGKNIGFSAGNNYGAKYATDHGAEYVFLHNADGYLADGAIEELVRVMEHDRKIGECQPLMLLHPEKVLINSAGNSFHYLGIGYCNNYRELVKNFREYENVGYISGAAAFMRADLLKKYGYWSEDFFLYHEDTEYSLRLKVRAYKIGLAGKAVFYHQYSFSNKPNKFYWIERNRHALQLIFYKWPTIIVLLPLEIIYNLGLIFVSIFGGWFVELLKVYKYWLKLSNWKTWLAQRRVIQKDRIINDRMLISGAAVRVGTGDLKLPWLARICVNIVFTLYWYLIKIIVWW